MKESLTAFDIVVLSRELDSELSGYYIDNIYQVNPSTLVLKLNKPGDTTKQLVLRSGRCAYTTKYELEKPKTPSVFCSALRKYLTNSKIQNIGQHDFERLIYITASKPNQTYRLIVELFSKGNIILLGSEDEILHALSYRKQKDRVILRRERFIYPNPSGLDPRSLQLKDLARIREIKGSVIRALTRLLAIGGLYAEEFVLSAGIDKNAECDRLTDAELNRLYEAISKTVEKLDHPEPCIVFNEAGETLDVTPFPLQFYSALSVKRFTSLNEALDEYFTRLAFEGEVRRRVSDYEVKIAEQQRILMEQTSKLTELKGEAEICRRIGEYIHSQSYELQNLIDWVNRQRQTGKSWSQIEEEAKKDEHISSALISIDQAKKSLKVKSEAGDFHLELDKSIYENASAYYQRSKQLQEKIKSVEAAIGETKRRIEGIRAEVPKELETLERPQQLPEKKWYEKYRFFTSSEGFLVVCGRDASSNEALIRRYVEEGDLVLHADLPGSPFAVIKTGGRAPSEVTIAEAAQFTVSYSRAWREGLGSADAYWVKASQVSKKAPSGEYLSKGAFMIYGPRNYLHGLPLMLAIGVKVDGKPEIVSGPLTAVRAITQSYIGIMPGDLSAKELASHIRAKLVSKLPRELGIKVAKLPLESFIALIPFGKAQLSPDLESKRKIK
ncbi:MAG: ribosome rescue protein RqcH [Candidatus Bathyarchaeia archaeon]